MNLVVEVRQSDHVQTVAVVARDGKRVASLEVYDRSDGDGYEVYGSTPHHRVSLHRAYAEAAR